MAAAITSEEDILLLSWNVAGWCSTNALLQDHYQGLGNYLKRMGSPGIFCVQESKVQEKELRTEKEADALGARVDQYRSFWAKSAGGLNGVATWVRSDIPVRGATQSVFDCEELDAQGRALLTDHGPFVVLNVYAPHVGERTDAAAKLRFLEAVGRVLRRVRDGGQRVVLCGDMNLTHRPEDQRYSRRQVLFGDDGCPDPDAEGSAGLGLNIGPFHEWANQWKPLKDVAERAGVELDRLGGRAGACLHSSREIACVRWLRALLSPAADSEWADVFAETHPLAVDRFTMWGQSANLRFRNIGTRIDYVICDRGTFRDCVVRSPTSSLRGASVEEGALAPPHGVGGDAGVAVPGEGATVDGTAEDIASAPVSKAEDVSKACGNDAASSAAACNAATNFGKWHGAAMVGLAAGDGLRVQADNMRLNDTQFPGESHTGLVYTPPSYSDHVPVCALFKASLRATGGKAEPPAVGTASTSKQCQPWTAQRNIMSFFKPKGTVQQDAAAITPEKPRRGGEVEKGPAAKRRRN